MKVCNYMKRTKFSLSLSPLLFSFEILYSIIHT